MRYDVQSYCRAEPMKVNKTVCMETPAPPADAESPTQLSIKYTYFCTKNSATDSVNLFSMCRIMKDYLDKEVTRSSQVLSKSISGISL